MEVIRSIPEMDALAPQQRTFVLAYLQPTATAASAAREAGYAASTYGWRILRSPKVQAAIRALRIPDEMRKIASIGEIRENLSSTIRDEMAKPSDRTAASSTLLKSLGALGGPEMVIDARRQSITYQVSSGTPLAILDVLDVVRRVARGEMVPTREAAEALAGYLATKTLDSGEGAG